MPTLLEKAAVIAKSLGMPSTVLERDGIAGIVRGASAAIGFHPKEGMTLGDILDAIASEVGCAHTSLATPAAPSSISAAAAEKPSMRSSAASSASSKSARKRPLAKSDQTLFSLLPDAKKLKTSFTELKKQRNLAAQGLGYEPEVEDMRTFRSERADAPAAAQSVATFRCTRCPRTFTNFGALRFHEASHSESTQPKAFFTPPPPPPEPIVSVFFQLSADGECQGCKISLDGRTLSELAAEKAAAAERAMQAEKLRYAEAVRRQRLREAKEAGEQGEHRQGSGQRRSYSARARAEMVEIVNRIHDNPEITAKGKAWSDKAINPKYYGVPFVNTSKWRKPDEHRRILRSAAKEHAGSLLRIDRESRQKGKYVTMEKELFGIFKRRRARGRKASPRWLTHTAVHLQKQIDPATTFKGGDSWRRRFRARFNISIRRKTNCKNTTWEETAPVLRRYFCALRRRVTLSREELATYAAAPTPSPVVEPSPAVEPYASFDEVDEAIKPLSDGVSLWVTDYPDTDEGNAALDGVLRQPEHAAKRARFAAMQCEEFDTFPRRVVQRAKLLDAPAARIVAPDALASVRSERRKFSRYLPWQRTNVDQVPLPFVNDMETTYEMRGAKRVAINQLGPFLSKRQATGQICFRPEAPPPPAGTDDEGLRKYYENLMEQPSPTIIFRGKGNISQAESDAYPAGLVVLWQDKAWVDRPTACEWAEKGYKPMIDADKAAGVADDSTRYLLFQDNLDAQRPDRNPEYASYLESECQTDLHMLPPGKTDQVQPVDDGLGRHVKIYMGQEEDVWLQDDDNLTKWEDNQLTASDRRILLATWFYRACIRALQGLAKRKYFEHTGALMTADGTDDDLIKLEGVPAGEKFTFMEGELEPTEAEEVEEEQEPHDIAPPFEEDQENAGNGDFELEDEDDADEEDAPPGPRSAPPGFAFASSPPSADALAFSKAAAPEADALVGRSILFHWGSIGWHMGTITRRNYDARFKRGGKNTNFYIHYAVDDDEVSTALSLEYYDGDDDGSWLLLEPVVAE